MMEHVSKINWTEVEEGIKSSSISNHRKKKYTNTVIYRPTNTCQQINCFDIESSSAWIDENGNLIQYRPHETEEFWNSKESVTLSYIQMFYVNNKKYFTRTLYEYWEFLCKLTKICIKYDTKCVIYIHNQGYEFEFLQNVVAFEGVFAKSCHSPMKSFPVIGPFPRANDLWETEEDFDTHNVTKVRNTSAKCVCGYIEFRCSYMLTRLSLEAWGLKCGCQKAVGFLDYSKLRTPKTILTDKELVYCEADIDVMKVGLQEYLEKYETIDNIPITQTGEISRKIEEILSSDKKLEQKMKKLVPKNSYMYNIFLNLLAGGWTHGNMLHGGHVVYACPPVVYDKKQKEYVMRDTKVKLTRSQKRKLLYSYDFTSSYPFVMVACKFPMTPFVQDSFDESNTDEYAYAMRVVLTNVEPKISNHYISYSHCINSSEATQLDNGRIIRSSRIEMWITEVDYDVIKRTYDFDIEIKECYSSHKEYLPKQIIQFILELYANKTRYKNVAGYEAIYQESKQFINSIFGLCVKALIPDEVVFSQDSDNWDIDNEMDKFSEWYSFTPDETKLEDMLVKLKGDTKKPRLPYPVGVWVTAYGRKNLFDCLIPNNNKVIYGDTDSLKTIGEIDFSWYNKQVADKIDAVCQYYSLDPELARPADPDGVVRPLGLFLCEDPMTEMVELGAKRYCYRSAADGELHITVSGVSKSAVVCLKDNIRNFNENLVFDKDWYTDFKEAVESGRGREYNQRFDGLTMEEIEKKFKINNGTKNIHCYTHYTKEVTWNKGQYDEYSTNDNSNGIAIRPTSYSMSIYDEWYANLIGISITKKRA